MGIVQVQNNFPAFEFAGESSRDYGVYITDVNVFDGASRDIELVDIPGRNGAYIIDNGRFSDIAITYDCAMGADGSAGASDFAENMAAIRAWLSSVKGYARLEDDINPDEYRMAAFSGGIKVNTNGKRTGEFSIEFTAKPERYLKSGETVATVTSGATITNPTKFSAAPLLMVDGYGDIEINGEQITITDTPIGEVPIAGVTTGTVARVINNVGELLNTGDYIQVSSAVMEVRITPKSGYLIDYNTAQISGTALAYNIMGMSGSSLYAHMDAYTLMIPKGYSGYSRDNQMIITFTAYSEADPTETHSVQIVCIDRTVYDENADTLTMTPHVSTSDSFRAGVTVTKFTTGPVTGDSSKGSLGEPLYIDLEYGEAYKEESGEYVSVNNAVSLPAELPKLNPGGNEITYTNHITELQMVPRWWTI